MTGPWIGPQAFELHSAIDCDDEDETNRAEKPKMMAIKINFFIKHPNSVDLPKPVMVDWLEAIEDLVLC